MLQQLGWKPIGRVICEKRCLLLYKYMHDLRFVPQGTLISRASVNTRQSARTNHSCTLCLPNYPSSAHVRSKNSFFYVTIDMWNRLPAVSIDMNLVNFSTYVKSTNFGDSFFDTTNLLTM